MCPNITHSLILVTVYIELHKCLAEIAVAILAAVIYFATIKKVVIIS